METVESTREKTGERSKDLEKRIRELEERLLEVEQVNRAIMNGEVDALVVREGGEERVYTLRGVDHGYRILVESITEGALILAPDNSIYYCNRCMSEMLRLPINKIIGVNFDAFVDPGSRERVIELIDNCRALGTAKGEFEIEDAEGNKVPVSISLSYVSIDHLDALGAIVTDLTAQKRNERELRELADKLRRSNEELQDFAFVASHDLQEPLRKVQAFGDMLAKNSAGSLDELSKDYLKRMQNAATRMRTLLLDLLSLSRVSRLQEPFKLLNLRDPVEEAAEELRIAITKTDARVEIFDLPSVEAIPSQMIQLFQNLIGNALKYHGEEPPHVKIYCRPADSGYIRVFVEDNGIGFDEQFLEQIFRPFQRLHGRSEFEGTGMGLAICRKIVERHDGFISATSKPGEGACFFVTLPVNRKNR
jgi:PAS domain S-box-containing protein